MNKREKLTRRRELRGSIKSLISDIGYLESVRVRVTDDATRSWCDREIKKLSIKLSQAESELTQITDDWKR